MCLVTREDVQPGYVHAPIVLDNYKEHSLPSRSTFPPRTISSQQQQYQSFITNGHGNIDDAKYYGNVIHPPLVSTEIYQHLAPLPLHILLGTTKKAMDILTDYCSEHDAAVKQIKGDTRTDTSLKDREIIDSIKTATYNMELYDITISTHKQNQTQHKKSSSQWHGYERAVWEIKRLKKKEEQLMTSLQQQWDKHAGPFIRSLDNIITSLNVKRQRYHGGAFVGNDCIRLLDGREQLSAVLKPQQFHDQDGTSHVIGSAEQSQLVFGLLDRLYHLHKLYSAARPLCSHEVRTMLRYVCPCDVHMFLFMSYHVRWLISKLEHMSSVIGTLLNFLIKQLHPRCIL
jgi:hypothetical protein